MLRPKKVYLYTLKHNQSLQSLQCTSKLIQNTCEKQFQCSYTKASTIINSVFAPMVIEQIKSELETAKFVTISTDASNHSAIKMFPVLIRYFLPEEGIKVRLIEYDKLIGWYFFYFCHQILDDVFYQFFFNRRNR